MRGDAVYSDLMKVGVALGVFMGLIALGWTSVFAWMNDLAVRDAGVPPHVWHVFQDYDADGELVEVCEMIEFVEHLRDSGVPRVLIAAQLSEFCTKDVASNPQRNLAACQLCFEDIVESVYRKNEGS